MSLRDILIDKFKEKGVADIIIGYKNDLESQDINQLKVDIFDLEYSLSMPYYSIDELVKEMAYYDEILANFDRNKYNIHNAYHKIEEIKRDIRIKHEIQKLNIDLDRYD